MISLISATALLSLISVTLLFVCYAILFYIVTVMMLFYTLLEARIISRQRVFCKIEETLYDGHNTLLVKVIMHIE